MNINEFSQELNEYFIVSKDNWVSIDIIGTSNVIDIVIVSDKADDMEKANEYIDKCFEKLDEKYSKGFIEIYSVEDSEYYGIQQNENVVKLSTWDDLVNALYNPNIKVEINEKKYKSRMVCFYSFKGGVGRTVALIQTAYSLALKGKNVLLIDFDIEAPSFQDVFGNNMKNMKWGLVDYLYERSIKTENYEIQPSSIYYKLKLDDSITGNIYIIPAGKMDVEYIHKLSYLQTKYISDNNYFDNLIEQVEKILNLDIVLIDSRTGINKWGAFSILKVADDLVLFSYPNKENIHGIKVVMELLNKAKKGNLTVVFSRVDMQDEENGKALALFNELDLQQEMLTLPYEPNIAVVKEYPVTLNMPEFKYMHEYDKISEFILEDDYVKRNKYYLKNIDKNSILNKLMRQLSNSNLDIITSAENKIKSNYFLNNIFMILSNKDVKSSNWYKKMLNSQRKLEVSENGSYVFVQIKKVLFSKYRNIFLDGIESDQLMPHWVYWAHFILYVINDNRRNCLEILKNKKLTEYVGIFREFNILVEQLKESMKEDTEILSLVNDEKEVKPKYEKVSHKYVIIFEDLQKIPNGKGWIKSLWDCKSAFENAGINDIGFKLIIPSEFYNENEDYFLEDLNESSIQTMEWSKYDVEALLRKFMSLNQDLFKDYIDSINNSNNYEEFVNNFNNRELINSIKFGDDSIYDEDFFEESNEAKEISNMNNLIDLLFGIRKISGLYTSKVIDLFYSGLETIDYIDKCSIINVIKNCIKYELEDKSEATDRLISIKNIEKAMKL